MWGGAEAGGHRAGVSSAPWTPEAVMAVVCHGLEGLQCFMAPSLAFQAHPQLLSPPAPCKPLALFLTSGRCGAPSHP